MYIHIFLTTSVFNNCIIQYEGSLRNRPFSFKYYFCFVKINIHTAVVTKCFWAMYSIMYQELVALPKRMSSPPVFGGVRVARFSIIFCVMFCRSLFFLLSIVLSVLRFVASDYPFGIFKLFLQKSYRVTAII